MLEDVLYSLEQGGASGAEQKFLTFYVGGQLFGASILHIEQIIGKQEITPVPDCPPCIMGVIQLRGDMIPVVDLCLRLEKKAKGETDRDCLVVAHLPQGQVAMVVDGVDEVLEIAQSAISQPPTSHDGEGYVYGIANLSGRIALLLDLKSMVPKEVFHI